MGSAVLLFLAFPPVGLSLLVFVAVAPWLASLRDTDAKGALKSSALFGFCYLLLQMFWIQAFVFDWTGKAVLSIVPWLAASLLGAVMYLPLGWLIHRAYLLKHVWLVPLMWAGHEAFRAYVPGLAFPWGILANPLWMFPQFVQHAAFGTVFFVSAWVMLPNMVLAGILWPRGGADADTSKEARQNLRTAMIFGGLMIVSTFRHANPPQGDKKVVTLGQPGVDMAFGDRSQRPIQMATTGGLIQNRAASFSTDLLVLPEGFCDGDPREVGHSPLGGRPLVPVVMGGRRPLNGSAYQTAFSYDGQWQFADKTRLVIFGEYVPFRHLPLLSGFNLPAGDLTAGETVKTLTVNGLVIGPLLCFEGVFPDLAAAHSVLGAQLLVQMSIDDWYERTSAWDQLWQSSVWRSIESGLPLARVGGRGQSLATDARGNIVAMVPKGELAATRVELTVPASSDAFPYRMGFAWLCWAAATGVWLQAVAQRVRSKRPTAA